MSTTHITVEDMHCAACHDKIRKQLDQLEGIRQLAFNPVRRQVMITHTDHINAHTLLNRIEQAGFHPHLMGTGQNRTQNRQLLKRLGVAGLAMMQVMMFQLALYAGAFQGMREEYQQLLSLAALLFCIPVVTYSAVPFFVSALKFRTQGVNMDTPIALAITIAFSTSLVNTFTGGEVYFDSVVMFTFLMLASRYVDQRLRGQLQLEDSLLATLPKTVQRLPSLDSLPADAKPLATGQVASGDVLWIAEGEQLPVDGTLVDDSAITDEALLTGETDWCKHRLGDTLFAGTFNQGPGFRLAATATVNSSRMAQLDRMAQGALDSKYKLARRADQIAKVFIPAILLLALLTWCGWLLVEPSGALSATLAVLVVSCPCALSLATPAALNAALVKLRRLGIMVKHTRALEVANLDHVFIDKTGTLTDPDCQIQDITPLAKLSPANCLALAAALQQHSSHPLARAFTTANGADNFDNGAKPVVSNVKILPGQGISGWVDNQQVTLGTAELCQVDADHLCSTNKHIYMSVAQTPTAIFHLTSPLRNGAVPLIQGLKARGLDITMVSGDNPTMCQTVADELDIHFVAQASPEAKNRVVKSTTGSLFIGDGMNDLPALTGASVSMATLETTDLVKSKADVSLLTPRLTAILDYLSVSDFCRRIMQQNLAWAVVYNLIAIPLAAFGYAPPWLAALGMSASSLLVLLNACRILSIKGGR